MSLVTIDQILASPEDSIIEVFKAFYDEDFMRSTIRILRQYLEADSSIKPEKDELPVALVKDNIDTMSKEDLFGIIKSFYSLEDFRFNVIGIYHKTKHLSKEDDAIYSHPKFIQTFSDVRNVAMTRNIILTLNKMDEYFIESYYIEKERGPTLDLAQKCLVDIGLKGYKIIPQTMIFTESNGASIIMISVGQWAVKIIKTTINFRVSARTQYVVDELGMTQQTIEDLQEKYYLTVDPKHFIAKSYRIIYDGQGILYPYLTTLNLNNQKFIAVNIMKILWDCLRGILVFRNAGQLHNDSRLDNVGILDGNFVLFDFDLSRPIHEEQNGKMFVQEDTTKDSDNLSISISNHCNKDPTALRLSRSIYETYTPLQEFIDSVISIKKFNSVAAAVDYLNSLTIVDVEEGSPQKQKDDD